MTFYPASDGGVKTVAPIRRRVGHEIELEGDSDLLFFLTENGLAPPHPDAESMEESEYPYEGTDFLHGAHCRQCKANDFPIHAVEDGTASAGEFHIGGTIGVLYGSDRYYEAIDVLCKAARENHATAESDEVGGHVHVSASRPTAPRIIDFIHTYEEELEALAIGDLSYIRDNENMEGVTAYNGYRWSRRGSTFEFRFWNSSLDPAKIDMSGGISAAIVEAAARGRKPAPTLMELIDPYITDQVRKTAAAIVG